MKSYVKKFFHRGLMFGGFGPIITGIVFYIVSFTAADFSLTAGQVLLAIVSTYLLAFVHAGASVFNQIEHWSIAKCTLFHFLLLYLAYSLSYIANAWIPFEPMVLGIFTAIFVIVYLVVWLTVYLIIRATSRRLNAKLK